MSVYYDILEAVASTISALNLTSGGSPVPVSIRKLPAKEESLDTLPLIDVCPHTRADQYQQFTFEDDSGIQGTYYVEVVLIFSGGRDLLTNLDTELQFRERVRRAFQKPPLVGSGSGAATVWNIMPDMDYVLDRSMINSMYDYEGMAFWFKTVEQRTN